MEIPTEMSKSKAAHKQHDHNKIKIVIAVVIPVIVKKSSTGSKHNDLIIVKEY